MLEIILLAASLAIYTDEHREPKARDPKGGKFRRGVTQWEAIEVTIDLVRILFLVALLSFFALFVLLRHAKHRQTAKVENGTVQERAGLLNGHPESGLTNGYGSTHAKPAAAEDAGWVRPATLPSKSWWEYISGYSLFFPYLWPAKSRRLQLTVVFCFILLMLGRVINVLVPYQVGVITNILSGDEGYDQGIPWGPICLFIFYRLLQGQGGIMNALRSYLWIPIGQYSYKELSTAAFEHVHGLSLDFHLGKKTGEVLSALGKGNSINNFLDQITFSMLPMVVDLIVAVGYFLIEFDAYYALVVAVMTFVYLYLTVRLAQWRADIRRRMVNAQRQEDAVKNDSMVSYETVKYFNAEPYEFGRYRGAVEEQQAAEYVVYTSLNIMNVSQNMIFMLGLLVTCFIAAYQVSIGQRKVGSFVALLTYMAQLQGPLNFFGTFYRSIQSNMINAERLLELFKERPTVVDSPTATELPSCEGAIRFADVRFAYDSRRPALNGLNFECDPGTTTALVGESGGGKSTIFRILFRFYNITSGSIQVDGHDVQDVTIDSFRRHMGVVPQDTVLFNESIMYNLKYANPNATDEQVHDACRAASIHDRIESFPDGYNSKVGERGLKLSGGEKQRIAIARTIIKNPRIILLDEATAALDTGTEQHIQAALHRLSQGRTTLIIAHRLSTITTADQILVLHQGQVAERGTHEQLLQMNGRYASMWSKQIDVQKWEEEAKMLSDRAEQLRQEVQGRADSASHSGDEGDSSRSGGGGGRGRSNTAPASGNPGLGYYATRSMHGQNWHGGNGGHAHGHGHD